MHGRCLAALSILLLATSVHAGMALRGGAEHIADPADCAATTLSGAQIAAGLGCAKDEATSDALDAFPYWNRRGYFVHPVGHADAGDVRGGLSNLYLGSIDGIVGWVASCEHCPPSGLHSDNEFKLLDSDGSGTPQFFEPVDNFQVPKIGRIFGENYPVTRRGDHYWAVIARSGETLPDYPMLPFAPSAAFMGDDPFSLSLAMGAPSYRHHDTRGWYEECAGTGTSGGCLADQDVDTFDSSATGSTNRGGGTPAALLFTNGTYCGIPGQPNKGASVTDGSSMNAVNRPGMACTGGEGCRDSVGTNSGTLPSTLAGQPDACTHAEDSGRTYLGPTYQQTADLGSGDNVPGEWFWVLGDNYGNTQYETSNTTNPWPQFVWYPNMRHAANAVMHRGTTPSIHQGWIQTPDVDAGFNHYRYWHIQAVWTGAGSVPGTIEGTLSNPGWSVHPTPPWLGADPSMPGQVANPLAFDDTFGDTYLTPYQEAYSSGDSGSHDFVFWRGKWWWAGSNQVPFYAGHPFDERRWGPEWQKLHGTYNAVSGEVDDAGYGGQGSW